ncbi:MAG TPA: hypothetical protein VH369_04870 [Bryobacteraceae bacterium]
MPEKLKICVFSKHFQWTGIKEAAAIAKDLGFDGVDLTVRKGGHVEPARVESDLPSAVEAVRAAGLEVPMITTEITDAATPYAGAILKMASQLGVRHYRWGRLTYQPNKGIAEQLNAFKPHMKAKSLSVEGAWVPHWCPTGEGMVNLAGFFGIVKENRFSGPVQLHFEYPGLGGAENGDRTLRVPKPELIAAMRRDLTRVQSLMRAQGLS